MKRFLLLLIFLPSICCASVAIQGATVQNAVLESVPKIMTIGDSITVGTGDSFTYNGTEYTGVGGYRAWLQRLIGIWERQFVGQWGNKAGTNSSGSPTLETPTLDTNYLTNYDFQPRHFGMGAQDIQTMRTAYTSLNQIDYFANRETQDVIIIHLGTGNSAGQYTGDPPNRVVDTSNVAGDVDALIALVDDINTDDATLPIIVCLIVPHLIDPEHASYDELIYRNDWAVAFNAELEADLITAQASKSNLYYVDMYTPMASGSDWYDGTYGVGGAHPNNNGYRKMAEILKTKMELENLL